MNHAIEFHLNQRLDEYDEQHRRLAGALNSVPRPMALTTPTHYQSLTSEEF